MNTKIMPNQETVSERAPWMMILMYLSKLWNGGGCVVHVEDPGHY